MKKIFNFKVLAAIVFSVLMMGIKVESVEAQGVFPCIQREGEWSLAIGPNNCNEGFNQSINECQSTCERLHGEDCINQSIVMATCVGETVMETDDPFSDTSTEDILTCFDCVEENGVNHESCESVCDIATEESLNIADPITSEDFDVFNPLKRAKKIDGAVDPKDISTPGGIISRILEFAFPLAGLILFVMISWGGFEMLYGASTSKAMEAGRQRVTAALIGFFLLFASYWIVQILEVVFGIGILK
jgi:hypothetical protein